MGLLLVVLLVLLLAGSGPWYPYSRDWGYAPVTIILVILLVWLVMGGVAFPRHAL